MNLLWASILCFLSLALNCTCCCSILLKNSSLLAFALTNSAPLSESCI